MDTDTLWSSGAVSLLQRQSAEAAYTARLLRRCRGQLAEAWGGRESEYMSRILAQMGRRSILLSEELEAMSRDTAHALGELRDEAAAEAEQDREV